jgi:endonuclease YncB( thermonuclease family)
MATLWNYRAKFIRAIDGDTIEVDIDLGFDITLNKHIRLVSVNTPERGQPGYQEAKDFVQRMLSQPCADPWNLRLITVKAQEKYGRYLAIVDASLIMGGSTNLSESLITNGLGVPYKNSPRTRSEE